MWSFIPTALYFKVLGYPTDCKITNQSTTNHLTGAVHENFIAADIICLLLIPSSLWIFPSSPPCYFELRGESSCPNTAPPPWPNCTEVIGPRDGFFCFKIGFLLTQGIWLQLPPDHDHKDISNPCEKCDSNVSCSVVCHRWHWSSGEWEGGGKGEWEFNPHHPGL